MDAYFSKAKDETSETMKEAGKNAFNKSVSDYEKMKTMNLKLVNFQFNKLFNLLCQNHGFAKHSLKLCS